VQKKPSADWIRSTHPGHSIEMLEAWFAGHAYDRHRHDTYAIGLTETGVQSFAYRGAAKISTPGKVVVLHPDEIHDGNAGSDAGFGYRMLYVEPARIAAALHSVAGRTCALPFVREPVSDNGRLAATVRAAFHYAPEPLAIDDLVLQLAGALLDADHSCGRAVISNHIDRTALGKVRQFLDAEKTRVVHSAELEGISGLSRYELARQFRQLFATSPYRYLLMRRLDGARQLLHRQPPRALAELALETGFADQAHFTRMFKAAFGITPARYIALFTASCHFYKA
jgi:AraC-like DNA-binding protein